ncbi:MAG: peptidase domain-containing ABC transporter [Flavobacterium sp.]|uniref:peptidase domain-containing ABC transporter n=1 Tax=Flavobacterium sp. TaxID=239 RepID=UPI0032638F05
MKIEFIPQRDQMDCGPACLSMISRFYGKKINFQFLKENSYITKEGVSLLGVKSAADTIGFNTFPAILNFKKLEKDYLPCILHWNNNHFVVLYKINTSLFSKKRTFKIADPGHGMIKLSEDKFKASWSDANQEGIALFLEPTEKFESLNEEYQKEFNMSSLLKYLKPFKKQLLGVMALLLLSSVSNLFLPLLTKELIDNGVVKKDFNYITYILIAQFGVFFGSVIFDIYRNWIMIKVGAKINIEIISDFLKKILKLPIRFFDTKNIGDFNQRIQDHERIENFLTSQSLITIFSMLSFLVFFGILYTYDYKILLVYIFLTTISVLWSIFWLKKRKILDYFKFQLRSQNQENTFEIITGVSEMKLNNFEEFKRSEWEIVQHKLYKLNMRILKIDQTQQLGFEFINQSKNILVTFLSAYFVIKGHMTLGSLLSVSFIIGQMNAPINQLISFFRSLQDAKLSFIRLKEVQDQSDEEKKEQKALNTSNSKIELNTGIVFKEVSFQYEGPKSPYILKDLNFVIPEGKITAIVGASGSGKTTLMKLLLKFYPPTKGDLSFNNSNIETISPKSLRQNCGVVMQDGFIFSDTIERNIATGDEIIDYEKLNKAIKIANIEDFIAGLPLMLNTKIGAAGNGISGGQRQRILIARAVYKNPHYIFFDEATSALDAENEKVIHDNLQEFFKGKTVLIIAHRLSTVKNADQIVVLKNGQIAEIGNHEQLVQKKAAYFNLVKNQLELGN